MCEDALALVEEGRPEREGGRTKTSRNRSLLPASYSHTDRPTDGQTPWLRRLPAPTSACSSALRPPVALRSPVRPRHHHRGCRQRRSGETGDGRAERRASSRQAEVGAGRRCRSVRPSVCWSSRRRRRRGCCRRRSRKKSFLQFSVRCASVAGGLSPLHLVLLCERIARREAAA